GAAGAAPDQRRAEHRDRARGAARPAGPGDRRPRDRPGPRRRPGLRARRRPAGGPGPVGTRLSRPVRGPRAHRRQPGRARMIYLSFLLLGLGSGAVYAALGTSLVVTYRSSGAINFATGAIASYTAYTFATLRSDGKYFQPIPWLPKFIDLGGPLSLWPSMLIALATAAVLGLLMYWVVFRWLINALPLAKIVASLGIMIVLQALVGLRFGTEALPVSPIMPAGVFSNGDLRLPKDRLYLTVTIVGIAVLLWLFFRFTR